MSADALALAVRAAAAYAGVRGPWWHHCSTMVLEPDPLDPHLLVVRDPTLGRVRKPLVFDPLPRKEIPMPPPPPEPVRLEVETVVMVLAERAQRLGAPFDLAFRIAQDVLDFAKTMRVERATTVFLFREVDRRVVEGSS